MTPELQAILKIKNLICNLPTEQRELCKLIAEQIRAACVQNPDAGVLAVSLVCAEGMALAEEVRKGQPIDPTNPSTWKPSDSVWPPSQGNFKGFNE